MHAANLLQSARGYAVFGYLSGVIRWAHLNRISGRDDTARHSLFLMDELCTQGERRRNGCVRRDIVYLDAAVLVDRFAILLIVSLSLMMPSRSRLAFTRSAASLGELRRKTGLPRKLLIKRLSSGSFDAR